jgi:site-specific DNA-methyltransferase (adenine-specific)
MTSHRNTIITGDCLDILPQLPRSSVDFILTDPPYITRYKSRDGRSVPNDDNDAWLKPAFAEMYRVLERDSFCVSFYGWNKADLFIAAWRKAGFRMVGHIVFRKRYASLVLSCAMSTSLRIYSPKATRCRRHHLCRMCSTGVIPATVFTPRKSRSLS